MTADESVFGQSDHVKAYNRHELSVQSGGKLPPDPFRSGLGGREEFRKAIFRVDHTFYNN